MKRLLLATLLILVTALGGSAPPSANGAGTGLVSWLVNHKRKTITVTVKLQIFLSDCPAGAAHCTVTTAQIASFIEQNIKQAWNGHHYKCYRLIFDVRVSVVQDRWSVTSGAVGILVDRSNTQGVRSDTRHTIDSVARSAGSDDWQSSDPAQRLDVTNTYFDPSTWSYPPTQNFSYAHEFGHVIGLDHYYDSSGLIAGAPDDVMNESQTAVVSQETIDRAVERSADLLVDTEGKAVDPHKLPCDLVFKATLKADEVDYDATHWVDSIARPPCSSAPFTSSTDQTLRVDSQAVEVQVIEAPELAPLGYVLSPIFDVLTLQNGLTGGGRAVDAVGLFDLPITVQVERFHKKPASGDIPPVRDIQAGVCTEGGGGTPARVDCGRRIYNSWMAMAQDGGNKLWPVGSSIPLRLGHIGYQSPRFEIMYQNCPGPTPWPGAFVEEGGAMVTKGTMPALDVIKKVAKDWYTDDVPGRIEIDGRAVLDSVVVGHLDNLTIDWTLILCPVNQDGETPPACP